MSHDLKIRETFWPNGKLKSRGAIEDGICVGQQVRYWENGLVAEIAWLDGEGILCGTSMRFTEEGAKQDEELYDDERRPGTYVRRDFDENGVVVGRVRYEECKLVESWSAPKSPEEEAEERALWEELNLDSMINDAVRDLERRVLGDDDDDNEDSRPA